MMRGFRGTRWDWRKGKVEVPKAGGEGSGGGVKRDGRELEC